MLGFRIYVQHPYPAALLGRHVTVDVSPFEDWVNFRFEGTISDATPMRAEGSISLGIALGRLSTSERYMVDVLTWTEVDRGTA